MSARNRFILVGLLALGLALRGYHYFREPSMWHDEAAVAVNVLNHTYADLLGPLTFHEAAPPLFLWLEKTVCLALGDGVYALRLPAFLASCVALPLLAWAACRLLEPWAVLWAVFLFAVSEQLAWHACEAKPYAFDVLAFVVLIALFAATRTAPLWQRLIAFALPAPLLVFLSYPAIFLYGGVLAASAPAVWREKKPSAWGAYGLLTVAVAGSFLVLARWTDPRPARSDYRLLLGKRLPRLGAAVDRADMDAFLHPRYLPLLLQAAGDAAGAAGGAGGRRAVAARAVGPSRVAGRASAAGPGGGVRPSVSLRRRPRPGVRGPRSRPAHRRRDAAGVGLAATTASAYAGRVWRSCSCRRSSPPASASFAPGSGRTPPRRAPTSHRTANRTTPSRATTGRISTTSDGSGRPSTPIRLQMQKIAAGSFTRRNNRRRSD